MIGTGAIAHAHAQAYLTLGVTLAAACDIDATKLREFREQYGVGRVYADYKEMLRREELDFVSVCTWPSLHCEMTIAAAEAGVRGILCEKPIALTLREADEMLKACERAGVKLAVAHIRRYSSEYRAASELLASDAVGEVLFIHGRSVGDMLSDGTHLADLALYLAGDAEVRWVIGQIDLRERRKRYGHYVEDAAVGYMELATGARVLLETSQLTGEQVPIGKFGFTEDSLFRDLERAKRINWWRSGLRYCSFRVVGSHGVLEVGEWEKPRLRYLRAGSWETVEVASGSPFVEAVRDLVRCVEEGGEPLASGTKARKALEVVMAIFESARLREVVALPINIDYNPLFRMIEGV